MILDMDSNITVNGIPCSLENDIMEFDDCVFRCVRLHTDNTLMYVRESNIHIENFKKLEQFKSIPDMLGFIILIFIFSMYLTNSILTLNKLLIN